MEKIEKQIVQRPYYYNNQLLREDDFLREQRFHMKARRHHNLTMHGYGVVSGLELVAHKDGTVTLNPGSAIDQSGNDLVITNPIKIDLGQKDPNTKLRIGLSFEEPDAAPNRNTIECFTWATITKEAETYNGITLALIHLDENGAFDNNAVDYTHTDYVVSTKALYATIKSGWQRMPFRPVPLVNVPKGETKIPPEFRVGATEAVTPDPKEAGERDRGAAGTMAISIPPNALRVDRLRIAGGVNQGEIKLVLFIGGWDIEKKKHYRAKLLEDTIASASPFQKTIKLKKAKLDPQYHTVSLWLRCTRRTRISLVATEFVYFDE